jgi:dTDP-4-amino-4,6-dideoxygalactose transaminase
MTQQLLTNDLKTINNIYELEIEQAIKRVLTSGWYILGSEVRAFEEEFADYCNVQNCIGLGNGTDALELALRSLDIGNNDEVITVANAGMYSTIAINMAGAKPVFADIDHQTLTMSANSLKEVISPKTRAIIITHLYGQMADMPKLMSIASSNNIPIIEDCAQAHGAVITDKKAGSFGIMGCFSFYPTKNLGAIGDGGAIITNDAGLAKKIRHLRQYGWTSKYQVEIPGGRNSRLDEIQAAILRVKLPYLDKQNQLRRDIAIKYNNAFAKYPILLPKKVDASYVAHLYVIRSDRRDFLKQKLLEQKISAEIHYPIPDYQQKIFGSKYQNIALANTETACKQILTLPCYPGMSDQAINQVISVVSNAFGEI